MTKISIDIANVISGLETSLVEEMKLEASSAYHTLVKKKGAGNDFLGWISLPDDISKEELKDINECASDLKKISDVVVVIGIGGSYLGAKAVIEALGHTFNEFTKDGNPHVVFAGQNLSADYHNDLIDVLNEKDYSVIVISKSGTTTEPAIAFRLLKSHLEQKYGKEQAKDRIVAITDKSKGALRTLADKEGYKTFVVPDDVGGRYSVLTPVGLLPIAVAGMDIEKFVNGAAMMKAKLADNLDYETNMALQYSVARNGLYFSGKPIEILVNYEPKLSYIAEWWKQLFGESEGKEGKGIFPAAVSNTTDLHSMGQYVQDGMRSIFETVISVENPNRDILIEEDEDNLDKLNYLKGQSLSYVNQKAEEGTRIAHIEGGVPNMRIILPAINENTIGQLLYFFEFSCGVSAYMLKVNPFDQPGVEAYKTKMFELLGKPGF